MPKIQRRVGDKFTIMALSDDDLKELKKVIDERREIEIKAREEALSCVKAFLSDPGRIITSAEETAIKQVTRKFNWGIIMITAATAISVGYIANQYVNTVEDRGREAMVAYEKRIDNYQRKFDSLLVVYNEKMNQSIDKTLAEKEHSLNSYVLKNEKRVDDFSDQVIRESKDFYKYAGLLEGFLKNSENEMAKLKVLSSESSKLQSSMIEQRDKLASINREILENEKVLEVLRNPKDHFVVNNKGNGSTLLLGNCFLQWGIGKTTSKGLTKIVFDKPIRSASASVSLIGEDLQYNAFCILKSLSDTEAEFVLINPKGSGWEQLGANYRYLIVGEVK